MNLATGRRHPRPKRRGVLQHLSIVREDEDPYTGGGIVVALLIVAATTTPKYSLAIRSRTKVHVMHATTTMVTMAATLNSQTKNRGAFSGGADLRRTTQS